MNRRTYTAALFAAVLFPAGAWASPAPAISPLALPSIDFTLNAEGAPIVSTVAAGEALAFAQPPPSSSSSSYDVRYRPRPGARERARERNRDRYRDRDRTRDYDDRRRSEGFGQLHAGFLDLQDEGDVERGAGFLLGFRGGAAVDPHVQIGGMLDWRNKSERETEIVSTGPGPGGEPVEIRREFARSSSNLFPIMGFLQVSGAEPGAPIVPYIGAGAGYEVLFLSAEDFATGEDFDGTFGGFGWQLWGGAALQLSGNARLIGEVFFNKSEVSRDVEIGGDTFREVIDMDGAGMRFGVNWGM